MDFKKMDITGNWHEGNVFDNKIIMSEPDIPNGETKRFTQRLNLRKDVYILTLTYDTQLDRKAGRTLLDKYNGFDGLCINGNRQVVDFDFSPDNDKVFTANIRIDQKDDMPVLLSLDVCNTRPLKTAIAAGNGFDDTGSGYFGILPDEGGEALIAHGIPFITREIRSFFTIPGFFLEDQPKGKDSGSLVEWHENMKIDCSGIKAKTIHFLGMIHNIDLANGSWFGEKGDHRYDHFAGDKAGAIKLNYTGGGSCVIPLIIGYNIWYCVPWDVIWHYQDNPYSPGGNANNFDDKLFCGMDGYRDVLRDGLGVVDAVRNMAAWCTNTRFMFSVGTDGRAIDSMEFTST